MGIYNEGGVGIYFGFYECFSGFKVEFFSFIKDKLKKRLFGWFVRFLFLGGKEVFFKAVVLGFSVYVMGCFKFSKTIIVNFISVMLNFWWNSVEYKNKIY